MSLRKLLDELSGAITLATSYSPDEYPEYLSLTYAVHKADVQELWSQVRTQMKRDVEKISAIDTLIVQMFVAFEVGDKVLGRKIAWDLWSLPVRDLR